MLDFFSAFERTARKLPYFSALQTSDRVISYDQLLKDSSRLGSYLQGKNIGFEKPVAIEANHTTGFITAVLACLRQGIAFLPLDLNLPDQRIEQIIKESNPELIVRTTPGKHQFSFDSISVETILRAAPTITEPVLPAENQLAYLIYSSGSTGRPRGILVEHRGLVGVLKQQVKLFGLAPGKKALWFLSASFDASISDIGTCLLSGACLVVLPDQMVFNLPGLHRVVNQYEITHIDFPPSLLARPHWQKMQSLETLILGGETVDLALARQLSARLKLINVYGPTEATICTSMNQLRKFDYHTIGIPLNHVDYTIRGENGQLNSQQGELYISGPALARGYAEQKLTSQRFKTIKGRRYFATGDKVRRQGHEILFEGRADRQLKIHGQLVCPEEIEATLARLFLWPEVAVLQKKTGNLVAYYSRGKDSFEADQAKVAQHLPTVMRPAEYIALQSLPRLSNQKIDYKGLKATVTSRTAATIGQDGNHPLLAIFRSLLKKPNLCLHDNLALNGLDSLHVFEASLLCESAGISLSPGQLQQATTLADLTFAANLGHQGSDVMTSHQVDQALYQLESEIRLHPVALESKARAILITGATGNLGQKVLAELLNRPGGPIYCLVRAADDGQALQRLRKLNFFNHRLLALAGDLRLPFFGLDEAVYGELLSEVGDVYHLAAEVNLVKSFSDLYPANITSTRNILQFVNSVPGARLFYASTLSVFVNTSTTGAVALEEDTLNEEVEIYGGYAQTKYLAEKFLHQYTAGPFYNFRLGLLTPPMNENSFSQGDFFSCLVRGLASLGSYIHTSQDALVDITPVDYAASLVAELAQAAPGGTFHISSQQTLSYQQLIHHLQKFTRLQPLGKAEFLRQANRGLNTDESIAWYTMSRFIDEATFQKNQPLDLFQATGMTFDNRNVRRYNQGIKTIEVTPALVDFYIESALGAMVHQ